MNKVDCRNMDIKAIDDLPGDQLEYDQGDSVLVEYDSLSDLIDEANHFRKVLIRILNPIEYIKQKADSEGNILNGAMAFQIANDAEYLKSLAKEGIFKNPRDRHKNREEIEDEINKDVSNLL